MSLKNDSAPTQLPHPMVTEWASRNGITITSSRVGKHGAILSEGVATSPSTEYHTGLPKPETKAKGA